MADEAIITPEVEKITPPEGTVEAEIAKETPPEPAKPEPQTVPLSVFLALKEDLKDLKDEIKNSKGDKNTIKTEGVAELAKKYPQVEQEFIEDILNSAKTSVLKEVEGKYNPIIEKQELDSKKKAFDTAFDKVYDKAVADNADLPKNINKEAIKQLALTPAYRNTPISEIITSLYGTVQGRTTTENEARTKADIVVDNIDFAKMTKEQKDAVLEDPKARKAYFNYLDTK